MNTEPAFLNESENIYTGLEEKAKAIYNYTLAVNAYQTIRRNYGLGCFMSQADIHALGFIEDSPGITAKQLAELTFKTKGTISTTLSHLEHDGYIEQRINPDNRRERNLYLTEKGRLISRQHIAYDRKTTAEYITELTEHCTDQEINAFFKVLYYRTEWVKKTIIREKGSGIPNKTDKSCVRQIK